MSAEKYPGIFSRQIEAIVYIYVLEAIEDFFVSYVLIVRYQNLGWWSRSLIYKWSKFENKMVRNCFELKKNIPIHLLQETFWETSRRSLSQNFKPVWIRETSRRDQILVLRLDFVVKHGYFTRWDLSLRL